MIKQTLDGVQIWYGKFWDFYIIVRGRDVFFSKERPLTDEEIFV